MSIRPRIVPAALLGVAVAFAASDAGAAEPPVSKGLAISKARAESRPEPAASGAYDVSRASATLSGQPDAAHRYSVQTRAKLQSAATAECGTGGVEELLSDGFEDPPLAVR